MTKEQQKLVEDNINLIYFVCHRYNYPISEVYDIGAVGLCKASINYDCSLGYAFSTYATNCILSEIKTEYRKEYAKSRIPKQNIISYNSMANELGEDYENDMSDSKLLSYDDENFNNIFLEEFLENITEELNDKDVKVLNYMVNGYSQIEIAKIMNVTDSAINKRVKRIRKVIKENLV